MNEQECGKKKRVLVTGGICLRQKGSSAGKEKGTA